MVKYNVTYLMFLTTCHDGAKMATELKTNQYCWIGLQLMLHTKRSQSINVLEYMLCSARMSLVHPDRHEI